MVDTTISHGIFFVTLPLVIIACGFAALTDDVIEAAQVMGAPLPKCSGRSCCP